MDGYVCVLLRKYRANSDLLRFLVNFVYDRYDELMYFPIDWQRSGWRRTVQLTGHCRTTATASARWPIRANYDFNGWDGLECRDCLDNSIRV